MLENRVVPNRNIKNPRVYCCMASKVSSVVVDTPFLTALKTWALLMVYLLEKGVQVKGSVSLTKTETNLNFTPHFGPKLFWMVFRP